MRVLDTAVVVVHALACPFIITVGICMVCFPPSALVNFHFFGMFFSHPLLPPLPPRFLPELHVSDVLSSFLSAGSMPDASLSDMQGRAGGFSHMQIILDLIRKQQQIQLILVCVLKGMSAKSSARYWGVNIY